VRASDEVLPLVAPETTVVGIDEVQFFDPGIVGVVRSLVAGEVKYGPARDDRRKVSVVPTV